MANDKYDCKSCLNAIGELRKEVSAVETRLQLLNNSIMKIVYALLGVVGANIGTKFIGTPWYIEIAMYTAFFSAIFVLGISVWKWGCLSFWERWIRIAFVINVSYVSFLRIYHYHLDTPLTKIEGVFQNLFLTVLAVGFIMLAWRRDSKRPYYGRRKEDD